jgi:NAD(P)-dependent dehydrogenase (short-subunit alcohol dehydrogenase family)
MPSLVDVKASNAVYAPSYIPTAVFIGGTSGIGQAMAELFAWRTNGKANIIIIGRNKANADKIIASFPSPPPSDDGAVIKHEFVQCDASELQNVHKTTQELLKRLQKINILVLCAATLDFSPHETSEGLERSMVLRYYSRAKFTHELMPLLANATGKGEDARMMTVLGAAMGGQVDLADLGVKTWTVRRMAHHTGTFNDIFVKVRPTPFLRES